ncbi:50S ribosomal protein L11 [Candidatus Woesearchaeota archaeon]|nr:50S ribosomal protein L11 [Candidatus Woesearchaeota archaeon]
MAKETIEVLIEGGKATAAPPLGPALGPMGVNIGKVVADINSRTQDFKGMQVPVIVVVDTDTKEYTISIGTPPVSQLIIKETGIKKGSSNPNTDFAADLKMEQIIKIAKMKEDSLLGKTMIEKVKEILGTCRSMGIMVEGKKAQETLAEIDRYNQKILTGKTELSAEELKELEEERKKMQEEIVHKHDDFVASAKAILEKMQGKDAHEIKAAMTEAGIPAQIIHEVMPEEEKKPEAKPGEAKPAAEPKDKK